MYKVVCVCVCVYYQIWLTVTGKANCDFHYKVTSIFLLFKFKQLYFSTELPSTIVNWHLEKSNSLGYFRYGIVNIDYDIFHWHNDNKLRGLRTCFIDISALYIGSIIIISQCNSYNYTELTHDSPTPRRLRISSLTVYLLFPEGR